MNTPVLINVAALHKMFEWINVVRDPKSADFLKERQDLSEEECFKKIGQFVFERYQAKIRDIP